MKKTLRTLRVKRGLVTGNTCRQKDCNDRPNYEIQELYNLPPAIAAPTRGLVNAVRFYDQVKAHESSHVETGHGKTLLTGVLKEACRAVNIDAKGE